MRHLYVRYVCLCFYQWPIGMKIQMWNLLHACTQRKSFKKSAFHDCNLTFIAYLWVRNCCFDFCFKNVWWVSACFFFYLKVYIEIWIFIPRFILSYHVSNQIMGACAIAIWRNRSRDLWNVLTKASFLHFLCSRRIEYLVVMINWEYVYMCSTKSTDGLTRTDWSVRPAQSIGNF
jgi:hypothetical protein